MMLKHTPFSGPKSLTLAPPVDLVARFSDLPAEHEVYARNLYESVVLGTDYTAQAAFWDQEVQDAAGNTPVQNQLTQNVAFTDYHASVPLTAAERADADAAWQDYLSWIETEWSGFAGAFIGYHKWWTENDGNTLHPNVNISGIL